MRDIFEKVNPMHPDKVADRISGAIVDLAYKEQDRPKVAVEVLIGHGNCYIIIESSVDFNEKRLQDLIKKAVHRISKDNTILVKIDSYKQDIHLAENQSVDFKTGDNGIFKGMPISKTQKELIEISKVLYNRFLSDGKYILDFKKGDLVICQSNANKIDVVRVLSVSDIPNYYKNIFINPLGYWTGGLNVDTGCTNRKLGSDMGDAITGGGLHGKDLSKADVSLNIYAHLKAQETGKKVKLSCAIGDEYVDGITYGEIVKIAENYIKSLGGFEKFAEWGLLR